MTTFTNVTVTDSLRELLSAAAAESLSWALPAMDAAAVPVLERRGPAEHTTAKEDLSSSLACAVAARNITRGKHLADHSSRTLFKQSSLAARSAAAGDTGGVTGETSESTADFLAPRLRSAVAPGADTVCTLYSAVCRLSLVSWVNPHPLPPQHSTRDSCYCPPLA